MSVHKSLRRISKNSYVKTINDLLSYAYSRTIAMGIEKRVDIQYQEQIIKYSNIALDRSFLTSSIPDTDLVDTETCDIKSRYLNQVSQALDVLSKYLSFLLGVMRENKTWIHRDEDYTMKVFQRFSSMIVDSEDSVKLELEYIKEKRKNLKLTYGEFDREDISILSNCINIDGTPKKKKRRGRRSGKHRNNNNTYKTI